MSFSFKSLFGKGSKGKKGEERRDDEPALPSKKGAAASDASHFKRDGARRSVHMGDRSFGAEHLSSYYQSTGHHKYPKGPKSCPGGPEGRDMDNDSLGTRTEFSTHGSKRQSKRGILMTRRDDRNSDYSSQEPSPMSSHFSRHERGERGRGEQAPPPHSSRHHYHSSLDEESDEENNHMSRTTVERMRQKLKRSELVIMELQDKCERGEREKREARRKYKEMENRANEYNSMLSKELSRKEREAERREAEREAEVHSLRSQVHARDVEIERLRRLIAAGAKDGYGGSPYDVRMTQQEWQMRHATQMKHPMDSQPRGGMPPPSFLAASSAPVPASASSPFGLFPSLPFSNAFSAYRPASPSGTPSTSFVAESLNGTVPDGAGESLWDRADTSFRPPLFNASLNESMPAASSMPFPFSAGGAPLAMPETPRSDDRSASTISLQNRSDEMLEESSSFRPPVPSSMPPRRISSSDPALSPSRKTAHSI